MKHDLLRKKNDVHTWTGRGNAVDGLTAVNGDIKYQFYAHGDYRSGSGALDTDLHLGVLDKDTINDSVRSTDPDNWNKKSEDEWPM